MSVTAASMVVAVLLATSTQGSEKEVRPGVMVALVGVKRADQWELGGGRMMKPKDPAFEYAVIHLKLTWPPEQKVFELASEDLSLTDAHGNTLDPQPLKVFRLMIEGSNEKRPVDLPFLVRKGARLGEFRMGKASFDLRSDDPGRR